MSSVLKRIQDKINKAHEKIDARHEMAVKFEAEAKTRRKLGKTSRGDYVPSNHS